MSSSIEGMINDCKDVYLCTPALKIYGVLNGIRRETANLEQYAKDFWEFSVTVDKYIQIDGEPVESNNYDDIKIHMYLFIDGIGYFKLEEPRIVNDGNSEYKEIVAYGCDCEFEERDWVNLKINTGDKDSLEQLADGNLNDLGYAKQFVTLYNTKNRQLSLIDNILDRMQGWTVGHIDHILKARTIPRIDVANASFYSILTSKVAPKLDCIFVFDILNRTINAYHKDSIDFETNIFIGFRNLANEVNIEVNEDSVFTRIKVRGDDELDFRNINFGSDQIWDLSYFMSEPWMDQTLVDKLNSYLEYRESQRDSYIDLESQAATITDKLYEVNYRVPSDQTYSKNWTSINEEGLVENMKLYTAQLEALQLSVDTRPDSQKYDNYTDITNRKYKPYTNSQGEVDHERYLELLKNIDTNGYGGYYTYKEIVDYIIPNIQVAMMNRNMPDDQKYTYDNGKMYVAGGKLATTSGTMILSSDTANSDVDWELYGIVELEAVKSSYVNDRLPALSKFSQPWSSMTAEEKMQYVNEAGYNMMGRDEYLKLQSRLGDKNTPGTINYKLNSLYETRDALQAQQDDLTAQMNTIKQNVALEKEGQSWSFTEEELKTINALFVDTDYTNTNILSTSIDTTVTKLEKQKELYNDAVEKLSSLSQPQYTFDVELDNLIRIPEFQDWADDLQLLRYVRLGIRDDYSVKLRIIGIRYNPCGVDEDLSLKFSSMITSKSGRNDFTELIENENNRAAKNSITLGMGNATNETEYLTSMLQLLSRSGAFSGLVRSLAGGSIRDTVRNYMNGSTIPVTSLSGSIEEFSSLFLTGLDADTIITILVNSANGQFERLETKLLEADTGKFEQLFSKYLSSEVIVTNILNASEADIDRLTAKLVVAHEITVDELKAVLVQVDTLQAESAFVKYLQSVSSTTATSVVNQEYVKNLVANFVSVADLAAGDITLSDAMQIVSENGKLVMNGSALQIQGTDKDGNEFTAIQLGYDSKNNPSFIINSEDGSAVFTSTGINIKDKDDNVLFSAGSGITANAIANELIVNNMIKDGTIGEGKLGFSVWKKTDEITIQNIYTESGGSLFGTEWATYKNTVDNVENKLADTITGVETQYYSSTSRTSKQGGKWITDPSLLDYSAGHYIWQRTVTTYGDGDTSESDAVMISGNDGMQGEQGIPGTAGKTSYFHVKYSSYEQPTSSSQMTETPSTFIGTYVDFTETDSNNPYDYTWSRFQGKPGEQGIQGENGADGTTYYLHIKYSNDGGNTFTNNSGEVAGEYIGTLVDTNQEDTMNIRAYTWAKIKGEQGIQGLPGTNGKTSYFHIKYSSEANPTSSSQMTETPSTYIGTYVDFNQTDSTDPSQYTWSRFEGLQGEQGIPGTNGEDGTTSYLHIKYSNDGGTTFTTNGGEDVGEYIGTLVDTVETDSTTPSDYSWAKIKGEQGIPGQDGKTSYFHIKYSSVSNPTASSQLSETPSTYIGTYVDFTLEDSTDPSKYTWARFEGMQGAQGIPGTNGEDGTTHYLHIKYSNDGGITFTANGGEDAGQYMGTLVDENAADSTTPSDYSWAKIQGRSISDITPMYYKSTTTDRTKIPNPPANGVTNLAVKTGDLNVTSGKLTINLDGWSTDAPVWSTGMYVWVCSRITYDDATIEYTEPYCDSSWTAANKVQEGLDNLQGDLLDTKMDLISSINGVRTIADNNNMSINNKIWKTDINATVSNMNVGGVNLFDHDTFYSYKNGALNSPANITKSGASYSVTGNPNSYVGFLLDTSNLTTISDRQQIIVDGYFTRSDTATNAYTGVVIKYQCLNKSGAKLNGEQTVNITFNTNEDGKPVSNRFSTIIDVPSEAMSIRIGIGQTYSKPYAISYLTIKDAGLYDITSDIRDRLVEQTMDLDGIHTSILDMESTIGDNDTEGSILKRLTTQETTASGFRTEISQISDTLGTTKTTAEQTANKFEWLVKSGTSASNMVLQDTFISLISDNINLNGKVTFNSFDSSTKASLETASNWVSNNSTDFTNIETMLANWAYQEAISDTTTINGGYIQTNTIEANKLNVTTLSAITGNVGTLTAGEIQSSDYDYTSGLFTNAGLIIDLTNGIFRSKNMLIEAGETGDAYFNGILVAKELFVGMDYNDVVSGVAGSYICYKDDKLLINTPGLTVTEDSATFSGSLNAATGSFKGELSAATGSFTGTVTAENGSIGGWTITQTSLYRGNASYGQNGNGNIYLGADGFSLSSKFGYNTSDGSLTISADTIKIFNGVEDYDDISTLISNAAGTATNYLVYDNTGLSIYKTATDTAKFNVQLTGSAVNIRNGTTIYASYGTTTTFYEPGTTNKAIVLGSNGIDFYKIGTTSTAMTLTSSGISLTSGSININSRFIVSSAGALTLTSASDSSNRYCELTMTSNGLKLNGYKTVSGSRSLYNDISFDLYNGIMLESYGNIDDSLMSKVGTRYYFGSSARNRKEVYLVADEDGAGIYYWQQGYYADGVSTRGYSLIYSDLDGVVYVGGGRNVQITGNLIGGTNGLIIGSNATFNNHIYMDNNKNIYGKFVSGVSGAQSVFTGTYLNLMSLNTKNNIHIGAENKADCQAKKCAEAIYLNAINVYAGSSGTVITVSDRNHKKDIEDFTNAKEFIMQLTPRKFKFTNGTSNRYHSGFIAQEVKEAMDNATGDFGVYCEVDLYETGNKDEYVPMLRYDEIIAPHVALTQEHETKIQKLQNEINELKEQIKLLLGGNG